MNEKRSPSWKRKKWITFKALKTTSKMPTVKADCASALVSLKNLELNESRRLDAHNMPKNMPAKPKVFSKKRLLKMEIIAEIKKFIILKLKLKRKYDKRTLIIIFQVGTLFWLMRIPKMLVIILWNEHPFSYFYKNIISVEKRSVNKWWLITIKKSKLYLS